MNKEDTKNELIKQAKEKGFVGKVTIEHLWDKSHVLEIDCKDFFLDQWGSLYVKNGWWIIYDVEVNKWANIISKPKVKKKIVIHGIDTLYTIKEVKKIVRKYRKHAYTNGLQKNDCENWIEQNIK